MRNGTAKKKVKHEYYWKTWTYGPLCQAVTQHRPASAIFFNPRWLGMSLDDRLGKQISSLEPILVGSQHEPEPIPSPIKGSGAYKM